MDKENDENVGATRVTRAKAAALDTTIEAIKKPLQRTKSTTVGSLGAAQSRKRAALGDVSNLAKNEVGSGGDKAGKKLLGPKAGLVSKAAQPTKIEKASRQGTTRSILGPKDKQSALSELKRPASVASVNGHASKKRHTSSAASTISAALKETIEETENVAPAPNKVTISVEVEKTTVTTETTKDEVDVEPISETVQELPEGVQDLDAEDVEDPLMVAEYVVEIFDYMHELEIQTMANPNYMDNQSELEWKMRGILVDWLLEVHTRFRLLPETLFLAVNIIDRFLSSKIVQLDRLQLVGVTAMFIASKYEEVLSPHVQNFRHVADDGFTEEEILQAEKFVLQALDWDLSYPNPMNFLRRISKADNYDVQTRTLGKYLLEISCLDYRFIEYPPSLIAAASMYLARMVLERGEWVREIVYRCNGHD